MSLCAEVFDLDRTDDNREVLVQNISQVTFVTISLLILNTMRVTIE